MGFKRKAVKKFSRSKRMRMVVHNVRPLAIRHPRKNVSLTTRSLSATTIRKSRPLTKRRIQRFRRNLWAASDILTKYKAIFSNSFSQTVVAVPNQSQVTINDCLNEANPFWTAAGGLQAIHTNNPNTVIPTLNPETLFVRHGTVQLTIYNQTVNGTAPQLDPVTIRVQLVYTRQQRRNFSDANFVAPAEEWLNTIVAQWPKSRLNTLQDEADYSEYYHMPVMERQISLKPGDSFTMSHRLKPKRFNADEFARGGRYPRWVIYASPDADSENILVPPILNLVFSYRLGFTVNDV